MISRPPPVSCCTQVLLSHSTFDTGSSLSLAAIPAPSRLFRSSPAAQVSAPPSLPHCSPRLQAAAPTQSSQSAPFLPPIPWSASPNLPSLPSNTPGHRLPQPPRSAPMPPTLHTSASRLFQSTSQHPKLLPPPVSSVCRTTSGHCLSQSSQCAPLPPSQVLAPHSLPTSVSSAIFSICWIVTQYPRKGPPQSTPLPTNTANRCLPPVFLTASLNSRSVPLLHLSHSPPNTPDQRLPPNLSNLPPQPRPPPPRFPSPQTCCPAASPSRCPPRRPLTPELHPTSSPSSGRAAAGNRLCKSPPGRRLTRPSGGWKRE